MTKLGNYDDVNHVEAACTHGVPSFFDGQAGGGHTSFYTNGKEGKKTRFRNIPTPSAARLGLLRRVYEML